MALMEILGLAKEIEASPTYDAALRRTAFEIVQVQLPDCLTSDTVRRQSFWFQRLRNLSEYLAHLVGFIMRRVCGVAIAGFRAFCV
ncbi:MAG: hypothetical protein KUG69_00185 [Marinosulfonomonas sp.]|nr:hypothetical protein [Marinosulfonomonas sp.]